MKTCSPYNFSTTNYCCKSDNNMKKSVLICLLLIQALLTFSCKINTGEVDPELGVDPNSVKAYIVTYVTEMGKTPDQIALVKGSKLLSKHLPKLTLATGYYVFDAWYLDDKKIIAGEYKIDSNITLKAKWNFNHYEYQKTDTSNYVINPQGNSSFSDDNGYIKATVSTTSISNFGLSRQENGVNYPLPNTYGFEQKVKCDTKIGWAGALWYNTSGYNSYTFEVHGDGSFRVQFHNYDESKWEKVIDLSAENSHIIQNDFNTIAMVPTRDSDFEVYVNGYKVGTIKRNELKITPGKIYYAATATKKGTTGNAWLKFMNYSQLK